MAPAQQHNHRIKQSEQLDPGDVLEIQADFS